MLEISSWILPAAIAVLAVIVFGVKLFLTRTPDLQLLIATANMAWRAVEEYKRKQQPLTPDEARALFARYLRQFLQLQRRKLPSPDAVRALGDAINAAQRAAAAVTPTAAVYTQTHQPASDVQGGVLSFLSDVADGDK